jgi:hypothetical protein
LKRDATKALEPARPQDKIHKQSRELLLQLADGTITPDNLLPKPVPWVWVDGKYVQKQ